MLTKDDPQYSQYCGKIQRKIKRGSTEQLLDRYGWTISKRNQHRHITKIEHLDCLLTYRSDKCRVLGVCRVEGKTAVARAVRVLSLYDGGNFWHRLYWMIFGFSKGKS